MVEIFVLVFFVHIIDLFIDMSYSKFQKQLKNSMIKLQ